ncbi:hypothetical protein ACTWPT_26960 [Nonomuraea sp. 3N208]|uniref:hypothetical protein n=1 Tax=Nonomuraea sp. 3N208 TaxID=3457421 RepID=UPI003FD523A0
MPNGRPVDQPNFWFASEKVQNSYMENWTPGMKNKELALNWVKAGGLDSFEDMIRAAKANPNDPRLAGFKIPDLGLPNKSRLNTKQMLSIVRGVKTPSAQGRDEFFLKYWLLVAYAGDISAAAKKWNVDNNTLTAVLIYEMMDAEVKIHRMAKGGEKDIVILVNGKTNGSFGLAQLEPWKA